MRDFKGLAARLLASADTLVREWLPNGKRVGSEWVCGSINGDAGTSFSVNLNNGKWCDFANPDVKGGDLISLYAGIHRLEPAAAYDELGGDQSVVRAPPTRERARKAVVIDQPIEPPPLDAGEPGPHHRNGMHSGLWRYVDASGRLLFYVARYDLPPGSERPKDYAPWSWINGKWQAKGYPKPRPLYGLDRLARINPQRRVMLVEGEKACDALAPVLRSSHVVLTWPGGASATATADWSALEGRRVDLWPDNDEAGRKAAAALLPVLYRLGCRPVRVINPEGQPEGWDAADAIADGWDKTRITAWISREGGKYLREWEPPAEPPAPMLPSPDHPPPADVVPGSAASPALDGMPQAEGGSNRKNLTLWESLGLDTSASNQQPPPNESTVYQAVLATKRPYWFDVFRQSAMTAWEFVDGAWRECPPREVEEHDFTALTLWFQKDLKLHKITTTRVKPAILLYANSRRRNCAQEWFHGLKWDGTPRLDSLFIRGFGAEDNEYHRAVSRNFLIGMVARVMQPGCQLDYMPILQGVQGNKKSSAFRIIGGEWFTEAHGKIDDKDFAINMRAQMLVELTELDAMERGSVAKLKGMITNRVDTYRVPYEAKSRSFPRQCVLIGATNRDDWNKDDTGARRFWPVRCHDIDTEWLTANREQLFAEAVQRYKAGECYWLVPQDEARRLQDEARERDLWHGAITQYIATRTFVRPDEILTDGIARPLKDQTKNDNSRVCAVLRLEGWVKTTQWISGKSRSAWRRTRIESGPEVSPEADEVTDSPASLEDQWSSET